MLFDISIKCTHNYRQVKTDTLVKDKIVCVSYRFMRFLLLLKRFRNIICFIFRGRRILSDVSFWVVVYMACVYIYALINFFMAGIKDPGVYTKCMFILIIFLIF